MKHELKFVTSVFSVRDLPDTELPEICISGRSNVGKSSLLNRLANRKNLARISQKPGKTRSLNYYSIGDACYMVDLPGYGYAKVPKSERMLFGELVNPYLSERPQLRGIIQLIDSRHGPISGDTAMLEWIRECDIEYLYVFTKIDKLSTKEMDRLNRTIKKEYGLENSVLFSAHTRVGTGLIWSWIERLLNKPG